MIDSAHLKEPPALKGETLARAIRGARPIRLRVLVVDDNRDAADTLGTLLRLLGAEVRVCYDGLTAVMGAGEFRPDAGVFGVNMPGGIDGCDLARGVRDLARGRPLLLVALTGLSGPDVVARAKGVFDRHLTKPADPVVLLAALASFEARLKLAPG